MVEKKELIDRLLKIRKQLWDELGKQDIIREKTEKRMRVAYREIIALAELLVFKSDLQIKVMKSGSIKIY